MVAGKDEIGNKRWSVDCGICMSDRATESGIEICITNAAANGVNVGSVRVVTGARVGVRVNGPSVIANWRLLT